MDYNKVLKCLGGFGRYQKTVVLLLLVPVMFDSITSMMLVFILGNHNHRCLIPDVKDDSFTVSSKQTFNISSYNASQCHLHTNTTDIPCTEWVYDTSIYKSTLISKFNMVCLDRFMRSHILLAHSIGSFFNAIACGFACDKWGRKPVLIVGILFLIIPNFIRPWIPSVLVVAACEFLNACGSNMTYVVPFIFVTEIVDPGHRVLASFMIYIAYCFGEYVILVYAYFIRDWETLIRVVSVPITICLFILLFVPESPRWLLIKGRTDEAMKIFKKTAKYNKTVVNFNLEDISDREEKKLSVLQGIKKILKSKKMLARFSILCFNWYSISFIYFGISFNTGDLGGDVYINYAISTTVETVAVLFCFFADKFPRKMLYCPAIIIGGVACLSTIFTSLYGGTSLHWLTIALAMVGKLGVTVAFFVIYLITTEMFPTSIRASVLGLCSGGARLGTISSSYIGKLGVLIDSRFGYALPLVIFGSVGTTAGLFSLVLPETRNIKLPETFEEALNLESCLEREPSDNCPDEKVEMYNNAH